MKRPPAAASTVFVRDGDDHRYSTKSRRRCMVAMLVLLGRKGLVLVLDVVEAELCWCLCVGYLKRLE